MFDELTYAKTSAGQQEIAVPSHGLSAQVRRILILVDGKRSVHELAVFARPGEMAVAIRELERLNLISLVTGTWKTLDEHLQRGFMARAKGEAKRPANDPEAFEAFKQRTIGFLAERLGDAAADAVNCVQRSASPVQLRLALRELERYLEPVLGEQRAKDMARRVGRELM